MTPGGGGAADRAESAAPAASAAPPSRAARALAALGIGLLVALWSHHHLVVSRSLGEDFTWPWRAARALLSGLDPYAVIRPVGPFPFDAYFKYPLPAALVAIPFASLPAEAAGALFIGLSVALLAWALTRESWERLPILLSGCVASAVKSAQWSPLLAAALLLSPWAVGLGVLKPNLGVPMFLARPSWRAVAAGAGLLALSLVVQPTWPVEWLRVLRTGLEAHYMSPAAGGPGLLALGPLLLLGLLRWRRPEARLLVALACVPQVPTFYDQLFLLLIPRTFRESATTALLSAVAYMYLFSRPSLTHERTATWILLTVYGPALLLVLRRPNEGEVPAWLDRAAGSVAWRVRALVGRAARRGRRERAPS